MSEKKMKNEVEKAPSVRKAPRVRGGLVGYFGRANLLTSMMLVFPLFIVYQLLVLVLPRAANGADLITRQLFFLLGSVENYLLFNVGLTLLFVIALLVLRKRQRFDVRLFIPVLIESAVYALVMGSLIVMVMSFIGISPALSVAFPAAAAEVHAGPITRIAQSIGAGVHEELVFRLAMLPLVTVVLSKAFGFRRWTALLGAFLVTSLLFSAAHHVIGDEPWRFGALTYRFFCGLIFAALFQFRGLAVAVYTHTLYDVYVMLFRG